VTEPPWLTPAESSAWRALIQGFTSLIDVLDRELQFDSGLSHAYFGILVPLSEHPRRAMRMSELAEVTRSSRSRLSHAVSRLEERGWVRRADFPGDKRGQLAELTESGFAVVAAAAPSHVETVRRYLIDQLNPAQLQALEEIGQIMIRTTAASDLPPRRS
jgi:DNA-binding MarR family transcriptional regulator